jgi:hypothetical protein
MARANEPLLRIAGICLPMLLASVVAHRALKPPAVTAEVSSGVPSAEELDSLSKYLAARAPQSSPGLGAFDRSRIDSYDPFASAEFVEMNVSSTAPVPQVRDRYVVTAILISRDKRVAVINDALVSVGSILPGGVRVTAIENDHVEIVGRSGTRRMLAIKDTEGT